MSQYLSHLAALTLNQMEAVQPRLASRFETPVDKGFSDNNDMALAQEEYVPYSTHSQSSSVAVSGIPVTQKTSTPLTETKKELARQDQFNVVESNEPVTEKSGLPGDKQKLSFGQSFSPFESEQSSLVDQASNKPVNQASYEIPKDTASKESTHILVERVREHFTETTHSEFVTREIAAILPDAKQKKARYEEPPHSVPVKPASIVVRTEQSTVGSNTPGQFDIQQTPTTQSAMNPIPAPTIQVTIGRIEIRATQVADKSTTKPRSVSTTMSLDDYLKQRNGGKA